MLLDLAADDRVRARQMVLMIRRMELLAAGSMIFREAGRLRVGRQAATTPTDISA